jgi:hypothetical protein
MRKPERVFYWCNGLAHLTGREICFQLVAPGASPQSTKRRTCMNRKKFDFPAAVAASLWRLGARPAQCYDWELDTIAGTLRVTHTALLCKTVARYYVRELGKP